MGFSEGTSLLRTLCDQFLPINRPLPFYYGSRLKKSLVGSGGIGVHASSSWAFDVLLTGPLTLIASSPVATESQYPLFTPQKLTSALNR